MRVVAVIILIFFYLLCPAQSDTAVPRIVHNACLAFNIGAATPVPLPATVRKINAWRPGLNLSVGYEGLYLLRGDWRLGCGIKLDYKGMTVRNEVLYMPTSITVQNNSQAERFEGYFSGSNETKVKNIYISMPLYLAYRATKAWRLKLGGYAAFMFHSQFSGRVSNGYIRKESPLGEKVLINEASFDVSADQNRWDLGLLLGTQHSINRSFSVIANLTWGIRPLLKESSAVDFKMYNIFLNLGLAYRL